LLYRLESSRAQRVLVLLEELNLKYDIKTYKRNKDGLAPSELRDVHPLGKSPVVVIEVAGQKPLVLAESAVICEYLADHWGKHLVPKKWIAGKEGLVHGETGEWMRARYFSHYIEGSFMSLIGIAAVIQSMFQV
jgi:glutathione S-transferase